MGPLSNFKQLEVIEKNIKLTIEQGGKIKCGGKRHSFSNEGYYFPATIIECDNHNLPAAENELFGPVLSVIPFETEEEAISIANDTNYGLANYIQSQDNEKVRRVARRLRSGMVDVNGVGLAVDAPFGGFKHSGIGREAGQEGIHEFLEVKSVGGWN